MTNKVDISQQESLCYGSVTNSGYLLRPRFQTGSNKVAWHPLRVGKLNFPFHFDVILAEILCFQYKDSHHSFIGSNVMQDFLRILAKLIGFL